MKKNTAQNIRVRIKVDGAGRPLRKKVLSDIFFGIILFILEIILFGILAITFASFIFEGDFLEASIIGGLTLLTCAILMARP